MTLTLGLSVLDVGLLLRLRAVPRAGTTQVCPRTLSLRPRFGVGAPGTPGGGAIFLHQSLLFYELPVPVCKRIKFLPFMS